CDPCLRPGTVVDRIFRWAFALQAKVQKVPCRDIPHRGTPAFPGWQLTVGPKGESATKNPLATAASIGLFEPMSAQYFSPVRFSPKTDTWRASSAPRNRVARRSR